MKKKTAICLLAGSVTVLPLPAVGESGYYFGTGFSYRLMSAHRFKDERRYIQRKRSNHDMVLGYRIEKGRAFFGPEINVERFRRGWFQDKTVPANCNAIQNTSYYCSRRSTYRVRGIYGRKLGQRAEVYGALGIGVMKGYGAIQQGQISLGINAGVTIGLGIQYPVRRNGMLRAEVVYDNFDLVVQHPRGPDGQRYSPSYGATTLKVSYIISF